MYERLQKLRLAMERERIDYYIVTSGDWNGSEYVGDYFQCRRYITGFTGSAGTAVIGKNEAGLWTDGRYFIQAAAQLAGSGVTLFQMGQPGVPSIPVFLKERLHPGECVAVDGRTISGKQARQIEVPVNRCRAEFQTDVDLIGGIWEDRPPRSHEPLRFLTDAQAGESVPEKLTRVRQCMRKKRAQILVLTALDEIAWLFNFRGNDIRCCPLALSYALVTEDSAVLYLQEEITASVRQSGIVAEDGKEETVILHPYEQIYADLRPAAEGKSVWADRRQVNRALCERLDQAASVVDAPSPVEALKAVKNATEQEGFRIAHRKDAAAMIRFLCWLDHHVGHERITEIRAARKLEAFRREEEGCLGPSFDPIIAYQEHGAIVHYTATEETDAEICPEGLLLMDTGSHFQEGTTDITRTVAVGPLTKRQKEDYTRVLKGNLRLAVSRFPYGCSGETLDAIARMPLWEAGMDYNHGTGHGVGCVMNVHEGPHAIRWRHTKGVDAPVLEPGMVVSDEPGLYLEGAYGIRLENLLLCREEETNEYGRFLGWEVLTLVPFDRKAVCTEMMSEQELTVLNAYHRRIREEVTPMLRTGEEKAWLTEATRPLSGTLDK